MTECKDLFLQSQMIEHNTDILKNKNTLPPLKLFVLNLISEYNENTNEIISLTTQN